MKRSRTRSTKGRGSRSQALALLALLALPAYRALEGLWQRAGTSPRSPPREETAEVLALRGALSRALEELRALQGWAPIVDPSSGLRDRYALAGADVLAWADPSPERRTLWIHLDSTTPQGAGAAVLSPPGGEGPALVGRLAGDPAALRVGRVRTVLDTLFRARFQAGETAGILKGSGRTDPTGHPLLEILHLSGPEALAPGLAVYTGGDSVFPPGIVVGRVVAGEDGASRHRSLVRSLVALESLERVVVVCDLARSRVARAERESER